MKLALSLLSLLALAGAAAAEEYPARPITLVVPYAAGGGNDIMARTAADRMSPALGPMIAWVNSRTRKPASGALSVSVGESVSVTISLGFRLSGGSVS